MEVLLLVASSPLLTSLAELQASRRLVEGRPCSTQATEAAEVNSSGRTRGRQAVPVLSPVHHLHALSAVVGTATHKTLWVKTAASILLWKRQKINMEHSSFVRT